MKKRCVSGRLQQLTLGLTLGLSLALLAGCASKSGGIAPRTPVTGVPPAPTRAPIAPEAGLDKNEVIIDKPSALRAETVGLMAHISAQQQARIAQALKEGEGNSDANVQAMVVQATPKMRSFIERLSCIRQYNDGGTAALQALAAPGVSFKLFVPPMHGTRNHNKASCLTVVSVQLKPASTQVKAGGVKAGEALQIKVSYLAEDSGESTTSNHEINKNAQGVWWFTR